MAKSVAKSASRALGFLICKDKALGGIPFECFTKCYNSLVQPVIDYGSSVWGTNGYSCVETVQYRACPRVGKMPAFRSKVHAGGIYRSLSVFTGVY